MPYAIWGNLMVAEPLLCLYDYMSVGLHIYPQTTSVFIRILAGFNTTFGTEIISYCSYTEWANAHLLYSSSSNNTDLVFFSVIASQVVNKKTKSSPHQVFFNVSQIQVKPFHQKVVQVKSKSSTWLDFKSSQPWLACRSAK